MLVVVPSLQEGFDADMGYAGRKVVVLGVRKVARVIPSYTENWRYVGLYYCFRVAHSCQKQRGYVGSDKDMKVGMV